jgi:ferredoxin
MTSQRANNAVPSLLSRDARRHQALAAAYVVPEAVRCVQCGICSFNCPLGIDVRAHAWQGRPVTESYCLSCGECVARCPRGVLRFESSSIFRWQEQVADEG